MTRSTENQHGFTLIELMIVVAIVGILASLAISAFQTYTIRSQVSAGISLLAPAKSGIATTYTDTGRPPANRAQAGLSPDATDTAGQYVTSVNITNGVIEITYGNDAHASISGETLYMTPYQSGEAGIVWRCGNATVDAALDTLGTGTAVTAAYVATTIENRLLPSSCR